MAAVQQTVATRLIRVAAGVIGLFAVVYVSWFLYAIYVLYPNEANYSPIGIVLASLMVVLAAVTVAFARSVWRRSSGVHTRARDLRLFTGFMVIFPVLISPVSPTTLVFVLFAPFLMFMNWMTTRSVGSTSTKK